MNKQLVLILFSIVTAVAFKVSATECSLSIYSIDAPCVLPGDTVVKSKTADIDQVQKDSTLSAEIQKKKKRLNGFCAFPLPLGFVAGHRIMMGTKPWVPVVYVATFGGCFGLLPLIDFFVIMLSKDISPYENNPNVFMWLK